MLPITPAVEAYSDVRQSPSAGLPGIRINGTASENFAIFVDVTPAFPAGVEITQSVGDLALSGEIRPKIYGIQLSANTDPLLADVYFGNEALLSGALCNLYTLSLLAEGQLVDNQAFLGGTSIEMRLGNFSVYLDQWEPVISPTDTWEEISVLDSYCEV